jgi:hypothetical protein
LSEDDPEFKKYQANYPSFLKDIDERYPQVCANCEPRVRDILSARHKAVKADNLRRVMDRSKNRTYGQPIKSSWKELLVLFGAFCYWSSVAIQLFWNAIGVITSHPQLGTKINISSSLVIKWLQPSVPQWSTLLPPVAGWGLVLGLSSLWWNPQLKTKLYWRRARMAGLNDYYKLQIIVIVARFLVWGLLQEPVSYGVRAQLVWAIHLVTLFLTALVRIIYPNFRGIN